MICINFPLTKHVHGGGGEEPKRNDEQFDLNVQWYHYQTVNQVLGMTCRATIVYTGKASFTKTEVNLVLQVVWLWFSITLYVTT